LPFDRLTALSCAEGLRCVRHASLRRTGKECSFLCSLQRNEPKKGRPAAWPKGSPRENHKHGEVTKLVPALPGLRHVTSYFRVYELRSAALQRDLKPKNKRLSF
jgi:hypothetical protein